MPIESRSISELSTAYALLTIPLVREHGYTTTRTPQKPNPIYSCHILSSYMVGKTDTGPVSIDIHYILSHCEESLLKSELTIITRHGNLNFADIPTGGQHVSKISRAVFVPISPNPNQVPRQEDGSNYFYQRKKIGGQIIQCDDNLAPDDAVSLLHSLLTIQPDIMATSGAYDGDFKRRGEYPGEIFKIFWNQDKPGYVEAFIAHFAARQ